MPFTSIALQPDNVAVFGSFKCADLSHRSGLFGCGTVDVADCTSEEKWAIVDEDGRWGISHSNTIDLFQPVRFWEAPKWAPVNMKDLTGGQGKLARKRAHNELRVSLCLLRYETCPLIEQADESGAFEGEGCEEGKGSFVNQSRRLHRALTHNSQTSGKGSRPGSKGD